MCPAFELNVVFGFCVAAVLKALTFFSFSFYCV